MFRGKGTGHSPDDSNASNNRKISKKPESSLWKDIDGINPFLDEHEEDGDVLRNLGTASKKTSWQKLDPKVPNDTDVHSEGESDRHSPERPSWKDFGGEFGNIDPFLKGDEIDDDVIRDLSAYRTENGSGSGSLGLSNIDRSRDMLGLSNIDQSRDMLGLSNIDQSRDMLGLSNIDQSRDKKPETQTETAPTASSSQKRTRWQRLDLKVPGDTDVHSEEESDKHSSKIDHGDSPTSDISDSTSNYLKLPNMKRMEEIDKRTTPSRKNLQLPSGGNNPPKRNLNKKGLRLSLDGDKTPGRNPNRNSLQLPLDGDKTPGRSPNRNSLQLPLDGDKTPIPTESAKASKRRSWQQDKTAKRPGWQQDSSSKEVLFDPENNPGYTDKPSSVVEKQQLTDSMVSSVDLGDLQKSFARFEEQAKRLEVKYAKHDFNTENHLERENRKEKIKATKEKIKLSRENFFARANEFSQGFSHDMHQTPEREGTPKETSIVYLAGAAALAFQGGSRPIHDLDFRTHSHDVGFKDFKQDAKGRRMLQYINNKLMPASRKTNRENKPGKQADDFHALGAPDNDTCLTIGTSNWFEAEVSLSISSSKRPENLVIVGQNAESAGFLALPIEEIKNDKLKTMISRKKTGEESVKKVAQDLYDFLDAIRLLDREAKRKQEPPLSVQEHLDNAIQARVNTYREVNLDETDLIKHATDDQVAALMKARAVLAADVHIKNGDRGRRFTTLLTREKALHDDEQNLSNSEESLRNGEKSLKEYLVELTNVQVDKEMKTKVREWMQINEYKSQLNTLTPEHRRTNKPEKARNKDHIDPSGAENLLQRAGDVEIKKLYGKLDDSDGLGTPGKQMLVVLQLANGHRQLDLSEKLINAYKHINPDIDEDLKQKVVNSIQHERILAGNNAYDTIETGESEAKTMHNNEIDEQNIKRAVGLEKSQFDRGFRQLLTKGYVAWAQIENENVLVLTTKGRNLFNA